jgi:hypothetical protein
MRSAALSVCMCICALSEYTCGVMDPGTTTPTDDRHPQKRKKKF